MKHVCTILLTFGLAFISQTSTAQVPKNIALEHFTNTRCGICASRNPGLLTNLNNNPEVLHLTIHPSSPYRSCVLNNHNSSENDDRTNYYSIYGGTPRIVIQGNVVSASTNYGSSSIFTPYKSDSSALSIHVKTLKSDDDSLVAKIVITAQAANTIGSLRLYAPAVEDTVFYDAPNGEKEHFNVFRKVLTDETIANIPAASGDSVVLYVRSSRHADWDKTQMYVMAILQNEATKDIEQAAVSNLIQTKNDETSSITQLPPSAYSISPNPFSSTINIDLKGKTGIAQIINSIGQEIHSQNVFSNTVLSVEHLPSGIYYLHLYADEGTVTTKLVKTKK